jgi:hypothetical protein
LAGGGHEAERDTGVAAGNPVVGVAVQPSMAGVGVMFRMPALYTSEKKYCRFWSQVELTTGVGTPPEFSVKAVLTPPPASPNWKRTPVTPWLAYWLRMY